MVASNLSDTPAGEAAAAIQAPSHVLTAARAAAKAGLRQSAPNGSYFDYTGKRVAPYLPDNVQSVTDDLIRASDELLMRGSGDPA